jgi:glycosyltransferase involved in cell wall biosynthesis
MRAESARRIASTLPARGDTTWAAAVDCIPADVGGSTWRTLRWLMRAASRSQLLILRGSRGFDERYVDLLAAWMVKMLRPRTRILMTDATWEPASRALTNRFPSLKTRMPSVARILIRLIDSPRVTYGVLSAAEAELFPRTWKVSPDRVIFTPFTHTLWPSGDERRAVTNDGYVFAGGNSLRDYGLLAAALGGSETPVRVAADWMPDQPLGDNFEVAPRSHQEFIRLLRGCAVCVVPLQNSVRSAGQQTYLNAMLLRKIVVVTDAPGARDYIEHGVTGLVVPRRAADLRSV